MNESNINDFIDSDARRMILNVFISDARSKLIEIPHCLESGNMKAFKIHVHAMKSAAANVGEMTLVGLASLLEDAAKNSNDDYIRGNIEKFLFELQNVINKITEQTVKNNDDTDIPVDTLLKLKTALEEIDISTIDEIIAAFGKNANMSDIAKLILIGNYNEAIKSINKKMA
ncbi:MAG: hypothetical protein LBD23_06170 [Oscillospiraceae bacterium]|jgi:HPt (histidine-containing phosphotransfer) domain-containing protein|nr:hypothetical protein [Oscillospiraceae bacterium]